MEFYELILFMTYFGQQCVNVFNFTMSGVPAAVSGSFGLVNAFGAVPSLDIYPAGFLFALLKGNLSDQVFFNQVRIKNPYDNTDFYGLPFPAGLNGDNAGSGLSPATAYSLRSNQVRLDIQAGQKRFVGVCEANIEAGGLLGATTLAAMQDIADVMSGPFTYDDEGNTLTYNLVVAKKYSNPAATPPIANAYFPTLAQQLDNIASGVFWTPRPHTSTQTTRQYGRGR
jgi:hypothetical protein